MPAAASNWSSRPRAVGPQIVMIAAGSATAQEQLDEGELRADVDIVRRQLGPNRIERLEPGEKIGVLGRRDDAGQGLVEVMVRVDEAGQHDPARCVDDAVAACRQARHPDSSDPSHPFDDVVSDEKSAILQFAAFCVHRHQHGGILNEDSRHRLCPSLSFGMLFAAAHAPAGSLGTG